MQSLKYLLEAMLLHCSEIETDLLDYTFSDFLSDGKTQRAVYMSLHQIGELSNRLPHSFRDAHAQIPWAGVRQIRNIISHEYVRIDPAIIWATIQQDIPALKEFLQARLQGINTGAESEFFKKDE